MSPEKRQQIKELLIQNWDKHIEKADLASEIATGYVLGPYGHSEHYPVTDILLICTEIEQEKAIENEKNTSIDPTDPGDMLGAGEGAEI